MYISNIEPSGSIPPEVFLYKKDMPRLTVKKQDNTEKGNPPQSPRT